MWGATQFSTIYALFVSFFWSMLYFVGYFQQGTTIPLPPSTCTIDDIDLIFGIYCDLPYMHHSVVGRHDSMLHWAWFS